MTHCSYCERVIAPGLGIVIVTIAHLSDNWKPHPVAQDYFHLTCFHRRFPTKQLKVKGVRFDAKPTPDGTPPRSSFPRREE